MVEIGGGHGARGDPGTAETVWPHETPAPVLNAADKVAVLRDYATRYPRDVMIETGLYNGRGAGMELLDIFPEYWAIDLDLQTVSRARSAVGGKGRRITWGDSGSVLAERLSDEVTSPALFWLDAHSNEHDWKPTPLLAEIGAILAWRHGLDSVVLIDDVRLMGKVGWPELREVLARTRGWHRQIKDDILRLTPL